MPQHFAASDIRAVATGCMSWLTGVTRSMPLVLQKVLLQHMIFAFASTTPDPVIQSMLSMSCHDAHVHA